MDHEFTHLPELADGFRYASISRKYDGADDVSFRVNSTDSHGKKTLLLDIAGHVVLAFPTTDATAEGFLHNGKTTKLYDPTNGEHFTLHGISAEAAGVIKQKSESGRGTMRAANLATGREYSLEEAQAIMFGSAPKSATVSVDRLEEIMEDETLTVAERTAQIQHYLRQQGIGVTE